jgi:hypothetical protein
MHNIDRVMFESDDESFGEDEGLFESEGDDEGTLGWEDNPGMASGREAGLAAELLSVADEEGLDRFLEKLLSTAASAGPGFARSDLGQAIGGRLKSTAVQTLPHLAPLTGGAPAAGTRASRPGATRPGRPGRALDLQTEGLSPEDREFETARAFVRFGQETAERALESAGSRPPVQVAQRAAAAAAAGTLPGLIRPGSSGREPGSSGRWVRHGNRIVLFGV